MRRAVLLAVFCFGGAWSVPGPARAQFYGWGYAPPPYYPGPYYPRPQYYPPYYAPPYAYAPPPYEPPPYRHRPVSAAPRYRWHAKQRSRRTRPAAHRFAPHPTPRGLVNPLLGPLPRR